MNTAVRETAKCPPRTTKSRAIAPASPFPSSGGGSEPANSQTRAAQPGLGVADDCQVYGRSGPANQLHLPAVLVLYFISVTLSSQQIQGLRTNRGWVPCLTHRPRGPRVARLFSRTTSLVRTEVLSGQREELRSGACWSSAELPEQYLYASYPRHTEHTGAAHAWRTESALNLTWGSLWLLSVAQRC